MTNTPWLGDACSLVEEFRAGRRSPREEMQATLEAVKNSKLNAVSFVDEEGALERASRADISLPFGGIPMGVKELDNVTGWPATEASVPFADRKATYTGTMVTRLIERGGATHFGLTTASEFGGVNVTRTVLNGVTRNPWNLERTPGGSSGGGAAGVAGGLFALGTGGDGGGSIRIPAGFNGLVGLKATYGRIPRGPHAEYGNLTVNIGGMTRSVRDTARWFDICNGHDTTDPLSLPKVSGWEAELGSTPVAGLRVAIVPDWGGAVVSPAMWNVLLEAADHLVASAKLRRIDGVNTALPRMGAAWSISGMIEIASALGDMWPACADDLTPEMRMGLQLTEGRYNASERAKLKLAAQPSTCAWQKSSSKSTLSSPPQTPTLHSLRKALFPIHSVASRLVLATMVCLHSHATFTEIPASQCQQELLMDYQLVCRSSGRISASKCCWN